MKNLALSQFATPLGEVTALANDEGLLFVHFSDVSDAAKKKLLGDDVAANSNKHLESFKNELTAYLAGELRVFLTPCVLNGTPFQHQTWQALERIPYGKTASYGEVAQSIHRPLAYRAVASANRCNMFAIRFPCHRVIKSNGDLCGYNGGQHRKQWLLDHEKRHS